MLNKMAATFTALCKEADFTAPSVADKEEEAAARLPEERKTATTEGDETKRSTMRREQLALSYNINIELPAVRDQLVYDAIFKALRDNLL